MPRRNGSTRKRDWDRELGCMAEAVSYLPEPSVNAVEAERSSAWDVLISTVISLRTKDAVTLTASRRLLPLAPTPARLLELGAEETASLIYPAGFYRTKAENLVRIAEILVEFHNGQVPSDKETLLSFPGVGLKTANLVLGVGFGIPAICVDIHVHRIANRRGWIKTTTPDKSEPALSEVLPEKWWIPVNKILVSFGQEICKPISPYCSRCPVLSDCEKNGVERSR